MTSVEHARYHAELVDKSGRPDLDDLSHVLLERVPEGCIFGISDGLQKSCVEWSLKPPHRLIALRLGALARAAMVWDFAHELGHVVIGHEPRLIGDPAHELAAWIAGWSIVSEAFPTVSEHWRAEFEARRDPLVEEYRTAWMGTPNDH